MNTIYKLCCLVLLLTISAVAQTSSAQGSPVPPPVSYSSVSQLNLLLSQLQQASQSIQSDLGKMRVDKWKTDGSNKRQVQADVDSVQRNLQIALPEIIGKLQSSPENLEETFRLYRNLDALYDVFGSVVESAGAFGSKDDFQTLQNDLSMLERSRRTFADRMDTLASSKEAELARLRAERAAQAAVPVQPKRIIVDDTETPKKPATKKKAPAKKPPGTTTPAANKTTTPPQ